MRPTFERRGRQRKGHYRLIIKQFSFVDTHPTSKEQLNDNKERVNEFLFVEKGVYIFFLLLVVAVLTKLFILLHVQNLNQILTIKTVIPH